MFRLRLLPWDYGIRNLFRRPARSALTFGALAIVVLLVLLVVGFLRGLETSLAVSGDPRVVLVHALGTSENVETSSVAGRTPALLTASLDSLQRRFGAAYVSPEVYLGTRVVVGESDRPTLGLVRGVLPAALLVRRQVQIVEGSWPGPGEVLAGRLAATKLSRDEQALAVGQAVTFEGRSWRISGRVAAAGSPLQTGLWCPLDG